MGSALKPENSPEDLHLVELTLNGRPVRRLVDARSSLALFLRESLGLTSVHLGCEHGVCGACTVVLDKRCVRSCLLFAVQVQDCEVETLEGANDAGRLRELQTAFVERAALQCGFCTPGMLLTAGELLDRTSMPSRETIREAISGNICRCTGYHAIVDAVEEAAEQKRNAAVAAARGGEQS
jgi:aerobic carbon-monoxide dehydrogenase small subunit